eukprot:s3891_g6.t1
MDLLDYEDCIDATMQDFRANFPDVELSISVVPETVSDDEQAPEVKEEQEEEEEEQSVVEVEEEEDIGPPIYTDVSINGFLHTCIRNLGREGMVVQSSHVVVGEDVGEGRPKVDELQERQWAFMVLARLADLLGADLVQTRLKAKRPVYSLFSGMECVKHAWQFVDAACLELWGFRTGLYFDFSARVLEQTQIKANGTVWFEA